MPMKPIQIPVTCQSEVEQIFVKNNPKVVLLRSNIVSTPLLKKKCPRPKNNQIKRRSDENRYTFKNLIIVQADQIVIRDFYQYFFFDNNILASGLLKKIFRLLCNQCTRACRMSVVIY